MERPDVCVVVLDSTRRDRTSVYGNQPTTPALAEFAARSTVYTAAYTPAPWTLPSHCSLFTGQFPSEHGVTNGFTETAIGLDPDTETITQRLADRGYQTAAFSNNPWVGELSGLDRGFDEFVEWNLRLGRTAGDDCHRRRDRLYSRLSGLLGHAARRPLFLLKRPFFTRNLTERASRWIDDGGPQFTFCNLMEAHSPYFPPRWAFEAIDEPPPGPIEPRTLNTRLLGYLLGRSELSGERRSRVLAYYDAALRYQDARLDRLFDAMREAGRFEDALIVVCSDHGKTLGEYDRSGTPSHYLRRLTTHVPLIVKYPGQQTGRQVDRPVELPRLFDVIDDGGATPLEATGDGTALTEEFLPHSGRAAQDVTRWRSLSRGPHTLLRREDGTEYLLAHDGPDERLLAGEERDDHEATAELRDALDDRVADLAASDSQPRAADDGESLGRDVESQLEDLGYLE